MHRGWHGLVAAAAIVVAPLSCFAFSASYDQKVTTANDVINSKVLVKDSFVKIESEIGGNRMVMIRNREGLFNYMPAENVAMRLPALEKSMQPIDDIQNYSDYLKQRQAQLVGTEVVNGVPCDIYEFAEPSQGGRAKAWVSKGGQQLPVRLEMDGRDGHVVAELSNVKVGITVGDEAFALPAGATVMDMDAFNPQAMMQQLQQQFQQSE